MTYDTGEVNKEQNFILEFASNGQFKRAMLIFSATIGNWRLRLC